MDNVHSRICGDCEYLKGCEIWNKGKRMYDEDASNCEGYTPIKSCSAYNMGLYAGRMQNTNEFVIEQLRDLADRLEKASQAKNQLSACLKCKKRKDCLDSVQAHSTTDECYEEDPKC